MNHKGNSLKKYLKVWLQMTSNSFQAIIASRMGVFVFLFGKLFRLGLYFVFVYFLFSGTKSIVGYSQNETLLFLVSFTFLGALGQMFFREAYRFRRKLVSGEFDFDLVKPIHPLFKNLAGGFDFLDLLTMPLIVFVLIKIIATTNFNLVGLFLYIVLLLNGFFIMMAIHVAVMAFGVITTEVDNVIMVYRDLETMGRFPIDIYKEPLRQILIFIIPIGIMFSIPVKALLGLLSWQMTLFAIVIGIMSFYLSTKFWLLAVKKYSSASS